MIMYYKNISNNIKIGLCILSLLFFYCCNERNGEKKEGTYLAETWKELIENSDNDINNLIVECKSQAMAYNFNEAHILLHKLESVYKNEYIGDWTGDYNEVYNYVFEAEAIYLCAKDDKESLDRLMFLLISIPLKGTGLPNGLKYHFSKRDGYLYARYDISDEQVEKHNLYVYEVLRFNNRCDKLIDLAISNKQWELADRILHLFKDVPSLINEQEGQHTISYSKQAKNDEKKKIEQAKIDYEN